MNTSTHMGPDPKAPLVDVKEFSLGFYDPDVPGNIKYRDADARKLVKKFSDKLFRSLTRGQSFKYEDLPKNIAPTRPIVSRCQVVFRGQRLCVAKACSAAFSIMDIKVGNRSQLVSSKALPARAFDESVSPIDLNMDTAAIAQDITVVVRNETFKPRSFKAVMFGMAAV